MDDYLELEGLLVTRLQDVIDAPNDEPLHVLTAAELADVDERKQHTPAVHVIYDGDNVPDASSAGEGSDQILRQRWYTVVAVKSARDPRTGRGVRERAGPLIAQVIEALAGWRPGDGYRPLQRVDGPGPAYSEGGYGYFPLLWAVGLSTTGVRHGFFD